MPYVEGNNKIETKEIENDLPLLVRIKNSLDNLIWEKQLYKKGFQGVQNWGSWECIREFVQNALGEHKRVGIERDVNIDRYGSNALIIQDFGNGIREVHIEVFNYSEAVEEAAGEYGTGLKRGAMVAVKLGLDLTIASSEACARNFHEAPYKEKQVILPHYELSGDPVLDIGSIIIFEGDPKILDEMEEYIPERFLGLAESEYEKSGICWMSSTNADKPYKRLEIIQDSTTKELVGDKVFRKDIFVANPSEDIGVPTYFSYNSGQRYSEEAKEDSVGDPFFESDARNSIKDSDFEWEVGEFWSDLFKQLWDEEKENIERAKNNEVYNVCKQFMELLESETAYFEITRPDPDFHIVTSQKALRSFKEVFKDVYGENALIGTDPLASKEALELGYKVISFPSKWERAMKSDNAEAVDMPIDKSIVGGDYEIVETYYPTRDERNRLLKWLRVISVVVDQDLTKFHDIIIEHSFSKIKWTTKGSEYENELDHWGGFVDGVTVEKMYLKDKKFKDDIALLEVLVHEFGHTEEINHPSAPANDGTRFFETYLGDIFSRIVANFQDELGEKKMKELLESYRKKVKKFR